MNNKIKIFEILYINNDKQFNINQIAKLANISVGSAFKILKEFETNLYVFGVKRKNAIFYQINLSDKSRQFYFELLQASRKSNQKKTKIIATINLETTSSRLIKRLIDSGANCLRIDTSSCTESSASDLIKILRRVDSEVPILLDILKPEWRLDHLHRPLVVRVGEILKFTLKRSKDDTLLLNRSLVAPIRKGSRLLFDNKSIELKVLQVAALELRCEVLKKGEIASGDRFSLFEHSIRNNGMSEIDRSWMKFAIRNSVDFLGVSFVKGVEDIRNLNRFLGYESLEDVIGDKIKVIVRMERKEALVHYKEIIREAYGVMIDRDNFTTEIKPEIIPKLQRKILEECNEQGKPAIVATQMLSSMLTGFQATKSEISNIANVVLDGASCLMLSEETAVGKYPVEAVKTMAKVVREIESEIVPRNLTSMGTQDVSFTSCLAHAISEIDRFLHVDALIVITTGGYTARMFASKGLKPKIIAISPIKKIVRQMHLLRGVTPMLGSSEVEIKSDRQRREAVLLALEQGFINKTDRVIVVASMHPYIKKRANLLEIHEVSETYSMNMSVK